MICNVNVTTSGNQAFNMPVAFAPIGASATGTVSMSHLTDTPNAALRHNNIRGMRVTTSSVQIRLISAGTSSDPSSDAERVFVTAIGNWY
jgi:hypothetical protein